MTHPKPQLLFFAGTDTEIGKTYIASLVARFLTAQGHRVGVYKPVASGCHTVDDELVSDDAVALWRAAGEPRTLMDVCPQQFIAPLAPPEAAVTEGRRVDADQLAAGAGVWMDDSDVLIVEGAGGLMSPLADGVLNIHLAKQLGAILIVVAANRLGVIHQTLATCAAAAHHDLPVRGIILNDVSGEASDDRSILTNVAQIERYTRVPILGNVAFGGSEEQVAGIANVLN